MESDKMEQLLEKYFEGETSLIEEKQLKDYFASPNVAPHLEQYRLLFGYFSNAVTEQLEQEIAVPKRNRRNTAWISIAASVMVLLGIGTYVYMNDAGSHGQLGTYDDPEKAFEETQKALALLSNHVNTGIESMQYVGEYEHSKSLIFKQ